MHKYVNIIALATVFAFAATLPASATSNGGPRGEATHNVFGGPGGITVWGYPGFQFALNMGSYHLGNSKVSRPGCCTIVPGIIRNNNPFRAHIPNGWFGGGRFNQDGVSFNNGGYNVMPGHPAHPATFGNPM